jgi:hypothetical protein
MMRNLLGGGILHGTREVVAHGRVYRKILQNGINCVDLPAHMVMVDVIDVFDHFCDLQIDDLPNPECVTLGQCKGYCIMWPKKEIKLISTSNFGISSAKRQKLDQIP